MPTTTDATLTESLGETAHRLTGISQDYDPLMDRIGNARFVLLGEASHGTHEFYHERAQITQRLIQERGFTAVAVEADWPDAWRANRYVRHLSGDAFAIEAPPAFPPFPGRVGPHPGGGGFLGRAAPPQRRARAGRREGGLLRPGSLQPAQ